MDLEKNQLPDNFILDITQIPGSSDKVCAYTIEHYKKYINNSQKHIREIAIAMVGNLSEYAQLSNPNLAPNDSMLLYLSNMANFVIEKNTDSIGIQSTARIKSFYSEYEKCLSACVDKLKNDQSIPISGITSDIIATRDVLIPYYQYEDNPEAFYKQVYKFILEWMEHIDELSKVDPRYGFEEFGNDIHKKIQSPKKFEFTEKEHVSIPEKDFTDYAFEIKGIAPVYRDLVEISNEQGDMDFIANIRAIKELADDDTAINELPLVKALETHVKIDSLRALRHELEQELISSFPINSQMSKDYKNIPNDRFAFIYKYSIKPELRGNLSLISRIDEGLKEDNSKINFIDVFSQLQLPAIDHLEELLFMHDYSLDFELKLEELKNLNLLEFGKNFAEAERIRKFSLCMKDYMKNPKERGYQSVHAIVRTPWGKYEKQIRTHEQNVFAERGFASHSNSYKPHEKTAFHRLKVPTPLLPRVNENGNVQYPIVLEPLDFNGAIRKYYHQGFEFFSNGYTLDEYHIMYPEEKDFDEAILALSLNVEQAKEEKLLDRIANLFRGKPKAQTVSLRKTTPPPQDNNSNFRSR